MTIEPRKLIIAVQKREALYNVDLPEYNDKNIKLNLWDEVCEEVLPGWNALDATTKIEQGAEIQKRWRSLRYCFKRELAVQKKNLPGSVRKRRRYIYFKQLMFLLPTIERRNKPFLSPLKNKNKITDDTGSSDDCHTPRPISQKPPEKQKQIFEKDLTYHFEKNFSRNDEEDDDRYFLLSLLPILKKFDEDDKLLVRVEIMNAIMKVQSISRTQAAQRQQYQYHTQLPGPSVQPHSTWPLQFSLCNPVDQHHIPVPSPSNSEQSMNSTDEIDVIENPKVED